MTAEIRCLLSPEQEMNMLQQWWQYPFQELKGGAVLQNMTVSSANLEEPYKSIRDHLA